MTISGSKVGRPLRIWDSVKRGRGPRDGDESAAPNSKHMWVTQIDVGDETVGSAPAPGASMPGDLVPVAKHKVLLPGGVKITRQAAWRALNGMLCGMSERWHWMSTTSPIGVIEAAAILGDYHPHRRKTPAPAGDPARPQDLRQGRSPLESPAGDRRYSGLLRHRKNRRRGCRA